MDVHTYVGVLCVHIYIQSTQTSVALICIIVIQIQINITEIHPVGRVPEGQLLTKPFKFLYVCAWVEKNGRKEW